MVHVFRLGPFEAGGRDAYAFGGVDESGALVRPEVAHTDEAGLSAIARRHDGPLRCEPAQHELGHPRHPRQPRGPRRRAAPRAPRLGRGAARRLDQDPAGIQGTKVSDDGAGHQVWARTLQQKGAVTVALLNRSAATATITATWSAVGLPAGSATVRDLWARADRGSFTSSYSASVPSHGTVLVKIVAGAGGGGETLTVTRGGTGTGAVASSPAGIDCGSTCSASYASGTAVTLTATPAAGSTFGGFGGACVGTGTCVVTMTAARAVTATFDKASGGTCTAASGYNSGNFDTTGPVCFTVSAAIHGWGCANVEGRTVTVNGTAVTSGQLPLPGSSPYTFSFTAGSWPWASCWWW